MCLCWLDVHIKAWLKFVFPVHIWMLVGLMILVSHFSQSSFSLNLIMLGLATSSFTSSIKPRAHSLIFLANMDPQVIWPFQPSSIVVASDIVFCKMHLYVSCIYFCVCWNNSVCLYGTLTLDAGQDPSYHSCISCHYFIDIHIPILTMAWTPWDIQYS